MALLAVSNEESPKYGQDRQSGLGDPQGRAMLKDWILCGVRHRACCGSASEVEDGSSCCSRSLSSSRKVLMPLSTES